MRILHVVHGYPPNMGGTQRLFQELSEQLVQTYGDEVTVFTTNAYSNYHFWQEDDHTVPVGTEQINGVTVRRFLVFNRFSGVRLNLARLLYKLRLPGHDWARTWHNGPIVPGLTQAIAKFEADVVTAAAFPLLHMQNARRGAQQSRKPLLYFGALHPEDVWGFERQLIYRSIADATGFLAATSFEKTYLAERGIDPSKITVLGAGVNVAELAKADGRSWRNAHQLTNEPLIAFVGQQVAHKGIDRLLQAMPHIWQALPAARLVIAGKPTGYSQTIHAILEQLPPAQRRQVLVLDAPPDAEKNGLLAACDVLALPSRHESFGMVLAEAWACGKPVVGCHVGGVAALVDDEQDGLLVPVDDAKALAQALLRLLQNPSLREKLGAAGKQKVESRYTWAAVTAVYREACIAAINRFADFS
ncbi:glycosyltransferase family 4 protein [Candidatus Leptofilum sp.]|uniref:glycosyltransferase family 4 protein n=1 Tax=Candidatus Leptofilum sp. TaxID=3241576 RepID=UPI003B5AFA04